MRTTVTLDPDTAALVQRLMRERGLSFKAAVNGAIRAGLARPRRGREVATRAVALGRPALPVLKALRLSGELEDDELLNKRALRK